MPECKLQCPLVIAALKETITEAPWLTKKYFPSKEADLEKDVEFEDVDRRYKREADGKVVDIVTDITKEDTAKVSITKVKRESATQWAVKGEDKVIVTEPIKDIEEEDSAARLLERGRLDREQQEREKLEHEKLEREKLELEKLERKKPELEKLERKKLEPEKLERKKLEPEKLERKKLEPEKLEREKIKKPNGESLRDDTIDEKVIRDECDPHCPRRISRKSIRRKLEERQSAVDYYLLNKGSGYFEDVCTCSLSCIVHALKNDSFVRSILASTALFVFGLKLCSELDAWYLPTRFS